MNALLIHPTQDIPGFHRQHFRIIVCAGFKQGGRIMIVRVVVIRMVLILYHDMTHMIGMMQRAGTDFLCLRDNVNGLGLGNDHVNSPLGTQFPEPAAKTISHTLPVSRPPLDVRGAPSQCTLRVRHDPPGTKNFVTLSRSDGRVVRQECAYNFPLTPPPSSTLPSPTTSPALNPSLTLISVWGGRSAIQVAAFPAS
jgi:hypothetical protein